MKNQPTIPKITRATMKIRFPATLARETHMRFLTGYSSIRLHL
jgi:hypothetical protein